MLSAALRLFSLATAPPVPRIQRFATRRISPLSRTRSASRHPLPLSLPNLSLPAPFAGGASRRRVSKRFAARRISPLWLGRIVKEGAGPLLDTPPPLPRPAFPATRIYPRGRVSGGGLPSRLPIVPGGFAGGRGAISALYRNPQPRLVRTHRPSRFSHLGTAEIASFEAADVCEASAECAPAAHGARPFGARTAPAVCAPKESGPLPEPDSVRFRDSAARLTGSPSRMP